MVETLWDEMQAVFDSDVLLDFLEGYAPAGRELMNYRERCVSIISWMELMPGANRQEEAVRRGFLGQFQLLPLTDRVADESVRLRRVHRLKLPDAISWATALSANCLLITRNTKDFPAKQPGVRIPYRR